MERIAIKSEQKITKEEAAEIIRRTDAFYEEMWCGNNHTFNRTLYRMSGVKADYEAIERDHSCCDLDYRYMLEGDNIIDKIRAYDEWKTKEWGCLGLQHFFNQWISCCSIRGPHGWICPNGEIGGLLETEKYGVEEDELKEDLIKIASEWPTIDFLVTLFEDDDREETGQFYVESVWKVKDGKVEKI